MKMINRVITKDEYHKVLENLNPPPARGKATFFRDQYTRLIYFVKTVNCQSTILISSIIPRPWDHDRRHLVRISYNNILKKLSNPPAKIFFITSYKPFLKTLYKRDGIHLSRLGSAVLRSLFCEKIDKAKNGLLK